MSLSEDEALVWALGRKKSSETVTVARCPSCREFIAIYVDQTARQETVPDTTPPIHRAQPSIEDR